MLKMLNAHNAMRTVLENRRITLELALRQLAQTVGGQAPDQEEIAAFFHDFMDGYWDAFEEATSHDSDDLREIDRQILQLQEEISRALGPEHQDVLSQYECLANSRMTKELDHAFLIGYQTAIRLLLMGVLPLPALVAANSTGEENGRWNDNKT